MKPFSYNLQVEDAQGRAAPIQRLADSIAGPFVYIVMTLSAATFTFWYKFATSPLFFFSYLMDVRNHAS